MKLMDVVMANIAACEMSAQCWSYGLALALVKVKRATSDEAAFFVDRERALVLEYAALDDGGNLRLTPEGRFVFADPSRAAEYERARAGLGDTEVGVQAGPLRVDAPAEIRPAWIEALEGFIEFISEG